MAKRLEQASQSNKFENQYLGVWHVEGAEPKMVSMGAQVNGHRQVWLKPDHRRGLVGEKNLEAPDWRTVSGLSASKKETST